MLRSPALRVLSLTARRILDRLDLEHVNHGGKDNGRLPVTFADLRRFGMSNPNDNARGFRELRALGFIEVTRAGRAGNAEHRTPNLFRITYLPANGKAPTDEWRRIATVEEAERIAREARNNLPVSENDTGPVSETDTATGIGNRYNVPISPVSENTLLSRKESSHLKGCAPGQGRHGRMLPAARRPRPNRNRPNGRPPW
jgi:hypothetical protein